MQKTGIYKPKTIDPNGEANRKKHFSNCRNVIAMNCEGRSRKKQSIFNSQFSTFNYLRANAQSRLSGILFALANGKLYFEYLKIFSVPENHLPPCLPLGGGTHSEVVPFMF
jgi:hypothetical protein